MYLTVSNEQYRKNRNLCTKEEEDYYNFLVQCGYKLAPLNYRKSSMSVVDQLNILIGLDRDKCGKC